MWAHRGVGKTSAIGGSRVHLTPVRTSGAVCEGNVRPAHEGSHWVIFDGFSGDCRLADVRFYPGLLGSVASGQTPCDTSSAICSLTSRPGATIRTRLARSTNAAAIRTAVFPEPVGMVTTAGSRRSEKCAAIAWMAPSCAIRSPGASPSFSGKRKESY